MVLTYYGEGGFRLQSGNLSLLIDPPNSRLKADVVIRTQSVIDMDLVLPREFFFPGEYEVSGIEILGWPVNQESNEKQMKTVYLVRWEEIKFGFLGSIKDLPATEILENLEGLDMLILPVGGGQFLSAKDAAYVVKQLEPAMVVPSHYQNADDFLKLVGQKVESQEKLVFKKKDIDGEKTKVILLEQQ